MTMPQLADLFLSIFQSGGRGEPGPGGARLYDCWGMVMAVHARFGVFLPDFDIEATDTDGKDAAYRDEERSGRWVKLKQPETPCLVVMATCPDAPRACNHFGTYIGNGKFLHAFRPVSTFDGTGVRTDVIGVHPWPKRIRGFWRWGG